MAHALQQTESAREMILAGLSHDLRTPLTRMRLEIEMSPLSDSTREWVDKDLEQVDQSINKLIEYARASSRTNPNNPQQITPAINISQALAKIIDLERARIERQGGRLQACMTDHLVARIEPFCLERIISNLFENIRRYGCNAQNEPEIFIRLARSGQSLTLEISDTGKGITQHNPEALLRPFARGDQARTGVNGTELGTGLGLAIVERLVTQADGTISLISKKNNGLLVQITFPLAQATSLR
jgi:two-component system osmolarity sensor histidine kinase EnvZ